MEKAQIDALLTAHGGRAQIVASLHLLRAPALDAPAHAFLADHERELATIDLQRWLSRASDQQRPAALAAMARLAARDPARYEHEIARAPAPARQPDGAARVREAPASSPAAPRLAPDDVPTVPARGSFDPASLLSDLDFDAPDPAPGPVPAASDGDLADLFGDTDLFDDGGPLAPSAHPSLDALIADLAAARAGKARAAWRARAASAAADTAESWASAVIHLPPEMRDAVSIRARVSPRSEERAALLEWLFQNGARRPELALLTLSLLGMGAESEKVESWLAETWIPKLLPDRSAWARHGAAILGALADRAAFSALDELFTAVIAGPGTGLLGAGKKASSAAVSGPVFSAFSTALLSSAERALGDGHRKRALGAAAALASLGPPARSREKIRSLRRKRSAKGEVATLLSLAERRARGPRDLPGLEDFIATVHVLSDAVS